MSAPNRSNWRAGFFLFVLPAILMALVVPALGQGYWFEPAGVEDDSLGYAITELEDVNGDGFDEFLVGIPSKVSLGGAGQVSLWFGNGTVLQEPDRIWTGTAPEHFGWSVANIGDVDGDGTADWAVGAPKANAPGTATGRVYVFYGGSNPSTTADVVITGLQGGDHFGYSISAAGDFNGDTVDDFIVGAPFAGVGAGKAGVAYVIYGSGGGPDPDLTQALALSGEISGDDFGWSVTDAGNFLGGNEVCVAVGAPLSDSHGGADAGAVYVFKGSLSSGTPDAVADYITGSTASAAPNSQFGYSVRGVGQVDSDSFDDLAVGAPFWSSAAGRVEILFGDSSTASITRREINGNSANGNFGWSLARVSHVSGSGNDDVLIGAPMLNLTATDAGRAYIYEGGSSATSSSNLVQILSEPVSTGTAPNSLFGWAVDSAGDFDGDGIPDYAVSAPTGDNGGNGADSGYVKLFHSSPGPVPALLSNWKAHWSGTDEVDLNFALSLAPERLTDISLTRQLHDQAGVIRDEHLLWSGPAQAVDDGAVNTMARRGDGFGYRDDISGVANSYETISYSLSFTTDTGESLLLADLAGPGAAPVLPAVKLALAPVWPNPANPAVNIRFRAAENEMATVQILDVRGRVVRELHQATGAGDWQNIIWNGMTDDGRAAASGVYLVRLTAGQELRTQRVVLAR